MTHKNLIEHLIEAGYLKTPRVIEAFAAVDRSYFVIEEYQGLAYADVALPIGFGSTVSQPATVAFMLEELNPQPGDKILDVGSGSGWTSALLAHIVGIEGEVFAVEIVPELTERARDVVGKHFPKLAARITFISQNASEGLSEAAPFQRIIAAASLPDEIPAPWKEQLALGGKIVAPVRDAIASIERTSDTDYKEKVFPGFVFVPFHYDGSR